MIKTIVLRDSKTYETEVEKLIDQGYIVLSSGYLMDDGRNRWWAILQKQQEPGNMPYLVP